MIDAYVRVSLVGIELLTVDARVVVASVDTYLRWAEAVHRLVLESSPRELPDMVTGRSSKGGLVGKAAKALRGGDGSKQEEEEEEAQKQAKGKGKNRGFLSKLTGRKKKEKASRR